MFGRCAHRLSTTGASRFDTRHSPVTLSNFLGGRWLRWRSEVYGRVGELGMPARHLGRPTDRAVSPCQLAACQRQVDEGRREEHCEAKALLGQHHDQVADEEVRVLVGGIDLDALALVDRGAGAERTDEG